MSGQATVTFGNAVPGANALALGIEHNPVIQTLSRTVWLSALIETFHLLFMAMLCGSTLVLALRTLGVTQGHVALAEVHRLTRPWLRLGVIGGVLSGIVSSMVTGITLVDNGAFFIKMVALVAAVLFALVLDARLRGIKSAAHTTLALAGFLLLIFSVWLLFIDDALVIASFLLEIVFGFLLFSIFASHVRENPIEKGDNFAQILAVCMVIAWSTVAISGQWIGFN